MLPWFPRDYLAATRGLTLAERGAYTDLLWLQWETGPLPDDPTRLARMLGCTADEFAAVWTNVRDKFEVVAGGLVNRRLEQHRDEALRMKQRRTAGATITNAKRWGGGSLSESPSESLSDKGGDSSARIHEQAQPSLSESPSESLSVSPSDGNDSKLSLSVSPPSPSPSPESEVIHPLARPTSVKPSYASPAFHAQVIAAYHEALPDLPAVKVWSKQRATALTTRILERRRDGKPADTVEYWQEFFRSVAASDFLAGRSSSWRADLEWLLRPENFVKVIEGRYENRGARRLNSVS